MDNNTHPTLAQYLWLKKDHEKKKWQEFKTKHNGQPELLEKGYAEFKRKSDLLEQFYYFVMENDMYIHVCP